MASTTSTTRRPSAATRKAQATQPAAAPATVPVSQSKDGGVLAGVTAPPRFTIVLNAETDVYDVLDHGTVAKSFPTPEAAQAAIELLLMMAPATANRKAPQAKAEAVKQSARRQLAHILVSAYASAFAAIPSDSPLFAALGAKEAAQDAANWIHHLPVVDTGEAWDIVGLPVPARSNWADGKRK